jgi:hypothetical protein
VVRLGYVKSHVLDPATTNDTLFKCSRMHR